MAIEHAKHRSTFGRAAQPAPGHSMDARRRRGRVARVPLANLEGAWKADRGEDARVEASIAKLYSSEVLGRVVDAAVQIHGGYGVSKEFPLERCIREGRVRPDRVGPVGSPSHGDAPGRSSDDARRDPRPRVARTAGPWPPRSSPIWARRGEDRAGPEAMTRVAGTTRSGRVCRPAFLRVNANKRLDHGGPQGDKCIRAWVVEFGRQATCCAEPSPGRARRVGLGPTTVARTLPAADLCSVAASRARAAQAQARLRADGCRPSRAS